METYKIVMIAMWITSAAVHTILWLMACREEEKQEEEDGNERMSFL